MVDRQLIQLTDEPIDLTAVYDSVRDPRCGGIALFVGTTREVHDGRPVALLSYEAYRPMAEKGLADLARRLRERYPSVVGVCMVHRLGEVPLAEASVAIAVSTPHRGEAFDACRFGIDTLKAEIPIWKKESYVDGSDPQWVANSEPTKVRP